MYGDRLLRETLEHAEREERWGGPIYIDPYRPETVQRFPNWGKARVMCRRDDLYAQPSDLRRLLALKDLSESELEERWWEYLDVSDLVDPWRGEDEGRKVRATRFIVKEAEVTGQKQKIAVYKILFDRFFGVGYVSLEQIEKQMLRAKRDGKLKTKQNPMRIFIYYRSALVKDGALVEA